MQNQEIKYGIGIQSFEKLRRRGCVYVDKTGYIPALLQHNYYFLSRPRRFGKSLFLSTLESYFKGKKELFEGLEIAKTEQQWLEYPVIHIDFNPFNGGDIKEFIKSLRFALEKIAINYGIPQAFGDTWQPKEFTLDTLFSELIDCLYRKYGREVVILIDEYDNALLPVAQDARRLEEVTAVLQPFFNVLKTCDSSIHFAFITGVSRFRNTTLFSGANNLKDISMDVNYASLFGVTQQELERYFGPGVEAMAQANGWTVADTLKELRNRYDGYRFTRAPEYVYNPFSLLNALDAKEFTNCWIKSGATDQLKEYLKTSILNLEELTTAWVRPSRLESTFTKENPTSLLFQTGYLTIRDFDEAEYRLGIPNQEVQATLTELVIPEFTKAKTDEDIDKVMRKLRLSIKHGDIDQMMGTFKSLLATVPYHEIDVNAQEKHLHLCFYIIFLMLGVDAKCEIAQSAGRVDLVAQTPWQVYVFEFKLDKSPQEALAQIEAKGYDISWQADDRVVYKIGVEFSSRLRTISSWAWTKG